ncbi:protein teflon isoform X2 [Drosophila innubila]|uniref:protein teflon isoform X2 n=1 Tax=Drosophila innubila TaxID=198719 RepID=UPI00148C7998|nr:protein teflon isoform X2 [Drosophila innubila]
MSSLINHLSDGCVNFEKCGDVVVSPKDNMIGVFCHFCCDIFTSLLQFLHHLQDAHNDVLAFTKAHNVYTVEQLMSLPDRSSPVQSQDAELQANCSNSSGDSGVPAESILAASDDGVTALNEHIKNALAAYDVKCYPLNEATELIEYELKVQDNQQHDVMSTKAETLINSTDTKRNNTEDQRQTAKSKRNIRIQEAGNRNKFIKRSQPLCNPKSYAIARSARKLEQQQRLSNIKSRIIRSLESDEIKTIRQPFREQQLNEQQKLLKNKQHLKKLDITKLESGAAIKSEVKNNSMNFFHNDNNNKDEVDFNPPKSNNIIKPDKISKCNSFTNTKRTISSPIIINKIEYLPKLVLNLNKSHSTKISSQEHTAKWNNVVNQMEKPENEIQIPRRRSSLTVESSPAMVTKRPARRPSYSAANSRQTQMQCVKPETKQNKRKQSSANISEIDKKRTKTKDNSRGSLNFDPSDSVVEFTQDLKTSQIDADSLVQLADPLMERSSDPNESILNQVEKKILTATTEDANKFEINTRVTTIIRNDLTLLELVGLPIIKDPNFEDREPVEYSEALRLKAVNFSKMLKEHGTVWNPKRHRSQFTHEIRRELILLTKEVNAKLKANISIAELKRILNLIHAWHVQQTIQKFFKKVTLSTTIEYYLLLFGFLPITKVCLYYCEWCEEITGCKTHYEKHRMTHQGTFFCPHCKKGFLTHGRLVGHVLSTHSKDRESMGLN